MKFFIVSIVAFYLVLAKDSIYIVTSDSTSSSGGTGNGTLADPYTDIKYALEKSIIDENG